MKEFSSFNVLLHIPLEYILCLLLYMLPSPFKWLAELTLEFAAGLATYRITWDLRVVYNTNQNVHIDSARQIYVIDDSYRASEAL